ncbi:MAG: hypothetical protein KGI54_14125 [Pseudomonadota bacterium]|nr:hypothetical protein [Pseudomonadota bacterium]
MSGITILLRPCGKTAALSVTNSAHAEVTVESNTNENVTQAAFLNTGASVLAVSLAPSGNTPETPAIPSDGNTTDSLILAPNMTAPVVIITPPCPFNLKAISGSSTASVLYVMPVGAQS